MNRERYRRDIWPPLWRRRPLTLAVIILAAALLLWQRGRVPLGTDQDRYHTKVFTCTHVADGDTIDIDLPDGQDSHTRIRLWGVDTPETAKSPKGAMYYGAEASAFTKSQVEGKPVWVVLSPERTRDKYHRLLAYVYPGDRDTMLNEEIIIQGYGYADTRFPHAWKERFVDLEKRARKQKVGLWQSVTVEQMPEWRQRHERGMAAKTGPPRDQIEVAK